MTGQTSVIFWVTLFLFLDVYFRILTMHPASFSSRVSTSFLITFTITIYLSFVVFETIWKLQSFPTKQKAIKSSKYIVPLTTRVVDYFFECQDINLSCGFLHMILIFCVFINNCWMCSLCLFAQVDLIYFKADSITLKWLNK